MLAGVARRSPKSGTHSVEMIRMLKVARDSALKARTQAMNQMKALVVTAPADLRQALDGVSRSADSFTAALVSDQVTWRPLPPRRSSPSGPSFVGTAQLTRLQAAGARHRHARASAGDRLPES